MKVKLFSHNDLDGVGCAVVGVQAFGESLDYTLCSYNNVDEKVKEFLQSGEVNAYDAVFITDISVNDPEVVKLIDQQAKKFMLIDHHGTAKWLNQYNWAQVNDIEVSDGVERLSSGTSAFFYYLRETGLLNPTPELTDFIEKVRSYDTWDWNKTNDVVAYQLNSLHVLIGHWKFIERFSANPEVIFNKTEVTLLEVEQRRIDTTIYQKKQALVKQQLVIFHGEAAGTYQVGVVFADNYHSELGNELAKENEDLDFIIMVNGGSRLSFRGVKDYIDLGLVAKAFGGGGHPKAAGAVLSVNAQNKVIYEVLNSQVQ